MLKTFLFASVALCFAASTVIAAPKDDVQAAAKKLADQSYAWTTTTESGFGTQTSQGKVQKDGLMWLSLTFGDNTTEVIRQGEKTAVKREGSWQSSAELAQGGQGGGQGRGFGARMLQNLRAPHEQAQEVAGKTKELNKSGEEFSGELTEEGAKDLLAFGGRRGGAGGQGGGQGPDVRNAKGTAKFWVKDGVLSKAQYTVQGTMSFNNEDRDINRTTTIEIKDVGTAKIEVPAEAKAKLQ